MATVMPSTSSALGENNSAIKTSKKSSKAGLKVVEEPISWGPCLCERKEGESGEYHATVSVESRTWPGINKPGGVGRITKRTLVEEDICGESVILALYTVRYLLGGSEKDVRETYISCTQSGEAEARKVCPRDLFTVPVSESRPNVRGTRGSAMSETFRTQQVEGSSSASCSTQQRKPSKSSGARSATSSRILGETGQNRRELERASLSSSPSPSSLSSSPSSTGRKSGDGEGGDREGRAVKKAKSRVGRVEGEPKLKAKSLKRKLSKCEHSTAETKDGNKGGAKIPRSHIKVDADDTSRKWRRPDKGGGKVPRSDPKLEDEASGKERLLDKEGAVERLELNPGLDMDEVTLATSIVEPPVPQITDLLETVVAEKASCPLEKGRMKFFSEAVYKVFESAKAEKLSLAAVKEGVRKLVPAGMVEFNEVEQDAALAYLENEENKVMVCDMEVYRI